MRTRRKKSEMPFADALDAAQKRLKHAQKERDMAVRSLAALDVEIPKLNVTIQALQGQLDATPKRFNPYEQPEIMKEVETFLTTQPALNVDELPSEEDSLLPEPDGSPILE